MQTKFSIRPEQENDRIAIRAVHDEAFGPEEGIPALVDDLRQQTDVFATVSMVAELPDGRLAGQVSVSHAILDADDRLLDVMVLSPLGVLPANQRQGIGSALIAAALKTCDVIGAPLVFLEGNHKYYGTRGFEKAMPLGFRRPSLRIPENAFQVARLSGYKPTMTGSFVYKDVHWRHGVGLYRNA